MDIYYLSIFFFFNDTATTEIYTLSLHDALPICRHGNERRAVVVFRPLEIRRRPRAAGVARSRRQALAREDRKSTRLNSSHLVISYAVFCLKKKKTNTRRQCSPLPTL